jgi:NitT/TauT family transport system substrate-binding protein
MKKIMAALMLLSVSIYILGCSTADKKEKAKTEKTKVTVAQWGQEKYLIYLPLYIALEKGFFAQEGLEINIKYSGNDDQVFAAVIKGEAQFGVGDPLFTAIARERGFDGKVVATIVNGVSIWGVTNNSKLKPIEKIEDLAGLRVGTFPAPSTNYALMKRTILAGGAALKNTKIIQAPIGGQLALLEHGDADIAMELEPATSLAISKGYKLIFSSPQFYGPFSFTGVTTSKEMIDKNNEVVEKFVRGLQAATQFCNGRIEETMILASKLFPDLDKSVVEMAVKRMVNEKTLPMDVLTSDEAWQKALQIRHEIGDINEIRPTEDCVDNSFALKAMKTK